VPIKFACLDKAFGAQLTIERPNTVFMNLMSIESTLRSTLE
jgi:hypothetical protein